MNRSEKLLNNRLHSDQPLESRLCSGFGHPSSEKISKALSLLLGIENIPTIRPKGSEVAVILKNLGVDAETIQAALLSDPRLRESIDHTDIESEFGSQVANLVKNVNWLNTFRTYSKNILNAPKQTEILRQMMLAMVNDVRAVVIKLGFRIERLKNLAKEDYQTRHYICRETIDIYSPLANRLGIGQLKWELEDLAFRYLQPVAYQKLASALAQNRAYREDYLRKFIDELSALLNAESIEAEIHGRPKHIYGIWRKLQEKQVGFDQLYDIRALRILVDKVSTCYEVLGLVQSRWHRIPKEFDDYIANPKNNGYQSLHTVIVGPENAFTEIQIRTHKMHQFAELGVAAHWRYKEGGKQDAALEASIASVRKLLEHKDDDSGLLQDFRTELYADRIFVLTPQGELKNLMKGATPLDFAYAVHTEVGHRCRGAKVKGKIVSLTYRLQSGDQVEILTAKQGHPSRNWMDPGMGYLKSSGAQAKVRAWFRQQDHDKNLQEGKAILETERQQLGISRLNLGDLVKHFHLSRQEELLIQIGRGDINAKQLARAINISEIADTGFPLKAKKATEVSAQDRINIQGIANLATSFARCCKPVPGDSIIGYITLGKGISIHQSECHNILSLAPERQKRLIEVDWGQKSEAFPVNIRIDAFDRQGLLNDITQLLANAKVNILEANSSTNQNDLSVHIGLTIEVQDTEQLSELLQKINQLRNVMEAKRHH